MGQFKRVGIVGATGAVGREMLSLLEMRNFPLDQLRLFASARSAGKEILFRQASLTVEEATPANLRDMDLVFFSAGAGLSRELAPAAVTAGAVVVDNSSAFRMDRDVPLVVPEVNPDDAFRHRGIIANPNCSTAITLMGIAPLDREFGLQRMICSTYQSVSGAGAQGMVELEEQVRAWAENRPAEKKVFPHPIAFNLIPQVDRFLDSGYTKEEMKMVDETRKILGRNDLAVSATCVRVPVFRAHSIAVTAEFARPVDLQRARECITAFPGVEVCDDPAAGHYPMPLDYTAREVCGVGRLRRDSAFDNGLSCWIVGDQVWKGAALNAVQIAELLDQQSTNRCR